MEFEDRTRQQTRRGFLRTAAAAAGGLALGGLASGPASEAAAPSTPRPRTISLLSGENNPDTIKVTEAIFAEFKQRHPHVTTQGEFLDFDGANQRLSILLGSGDPPDIGKFNDSDIAEFALQGLLEPVTDVVKAMGGVPENLRLIIDGEDYFVPQEINFWMLFYRRDLFEKAGLKPPTNWTSYLEVARALTDVKAGRYGNILVTNPATAYTSSEVLNYFWSHGVSLFRWDGKAWQVAVDEGENLERAAEVLAWFKQRAAYSPTTTTYQWADVNQAYASGKIGTAEYIGARTLDYLVREHPKLEEVTGVVQLPYSRRPARQASLGGLCVFKKPDRDPGLAKELLLNMVQGDRYIEWLWTVPGHLIPPSKQLFEGKWQTHPYLRKRKDLIDVIRQTWDNSYSPVRGPEGPQLNLPGAAIRPTKIYGTMVSNVVLANVSPKEAVKQGAKEMRNFMRSLRPFLKQ